MDVQSHAEIVASINQETGYFVDAVADQVAAALAGREDAEEVFLRALSSGDYTDDNRETLRDLIVRSATPGEAFRRVVVKDSDWAGQSVAGPWADALEIEARR